MTKRASVWVVELSVDDGPWQAVEVPDAPPKEVRAELKKDSGNIYKYRLRRYVRVEPRKKPKKRGRK